MSGKSRSRRPASNSARASKRSHERPIIERTTLRVFISYHTEPALKCATRLKNQIEGKFPLASVYTSADLQNRMGINWKPQVFSNIHAANAFIAVVDDRWSDKVHCPDSIVRQEVEAALRNPNIRIHFPFRLPRVEIPVRDHLPPSIRELADKEWFQDRGRKLLSIKPQEQKLLDDLGEAYSKLLKENTMPIAFVSSALALRTKHDSLSYFSLVMTEIVQQARSESRVRMSVVVKIPGAENAEREQKKLLEEVLENSQQYRAIIVNPFKAKALEPVIRSFCSNHATYPIFTVDQCFGDKPWNAVMRREGATRSDKRLRSALNDGALPCGVMCNWYEGGKLAGELLLAYLNRVRVEKPLIWVLTGNPGTEDRQEGFRRAIGDKAPIVELKGQFQEDRARDEFKKEWQRGAQHPHAVFCTNDEMALGVRKALEDIANQSRLKGSNKADPTFGIKIVGFDAIHDVTSHLGNPNDRIPPSGYYLNTIDVDIRGQVSLLIDMVAEYLRVQKRDPGERIVLVTPRPFVPQNIQDARVDAEIVRWNAQDLQVYEAYRNRGVSRAGSGRERTS